MPRSRLLTVLLAAVLLVGTANLGAFAATGAPLLLGKSNKAPKTTTLKTAKGPALSLKTKKGQPPLKVSDGSLVTKLNADKVDGADASALRTRAFTYPLPAATNVTQLYLGLVGLPPGVYTASYHVYGAASTSTTKLGCQLVPVVPESAPVMLSNYGSLITVLEELSMYSIGVSASGLVDTRSAEYYLQCFTLQGNITTYETITPSSVTFTKVDQVTVGKTKPIT